MSAQLQRLILTFRDEGELVVRCLYRSEAAPNPGTKTRGKEVSDLARTGLREALRALEGDVTMAGTSGFSVREDIMVASVAKSPRQPKEESAA